MSTSAGMIKLFFVTLIMFTTPALAQEPARPSAQDKGGSAIDPTENVKALNAAEAKRQDDLSALQARLFESKLKDIEDLDILRAEYNKELREGEVHRIDNEMKLRADYTQQLSARVAEQASALQKKGDDAALILSVQVTKSADDLRTLVKTTADEQSRNLQQQFAAIQQQFTGITTRLTTLEQAASEGAGRQKFQDPALASLIVEVQKVSRAQSDTASANNSRTDLIGWIVGGLGFLAAIGTFALKLHGVHEQDTYEPRRRVRARPPKD